MEALQKAILRELQEKKGKRIFSFEYQGRKIWIKQAALGEISSWHALLALLHLLTGNPLLAPTVVRDPKASLAHEVHRLKEWAALGVNVPRVLWESEEAIALEDSGQALLGALGSDGITKARESRYFGAGLKATSRFAQPRALSL